MGTAVISYQPKCLSTRSLHFVRRISWPYDNATGKTTDFVESDLLREFTVSPSTAKIAALGILMTRIRQLDHTVAQDKTASAAIKAISAELFWLSSLVTLGISTLGDTKGMSSR
jgi:hypothetical protein